MCKDQGSYQVEIPGDRWRAEFVGKFECWCNQREIPTDAIDLNFIPSPISTTFTSDRSHSKVAPSRDTPVLERKLDVLDIHGPRPICDIAVSILYPLSLFSLLWFVQIDHRYLIATSYAISLFFPNLFLVRYPPYKEGVKEILCKGCRRHLCKNPLFLSSLLSESLRLFCPHS